MNKIVDYVKASVAEMKKVTWPTKKDTQAYTLLVIGVSIAVSLFLYVLDMIFTAGFSLIINK